MEPKGKREKTFMLNFNDNGRTQVFFTHNDEQEAEMINSNEQEVVGYFAWLQRNGLITCQKIDAEIRKNAQPESIKRRVEATVQEHSLTQLQWNKTLDELAVEFPLKG